MSNDKDLMNKYHALNSVHLDGKYLKFLIENGIDVSNLTTVPLYLDKLIKQLVDNSVKLKPVFKVDNGALMESSNVFTSSDTIESEGSDIADTIVDMFSNISPYKAMFDDFSSEIEKTQFGNDVLENMKNGKKYISGFSKDVNSDAAISAPSSYQEANETAIQAYSNAKSLLNGKSKLAIRKDLKGWSDEEVNEYNNRNRIHDPLKTSNMNITITRMRLLSGPGEMPIYEMTYEYDDNHNIGKSRRLMKHNKHVGTQIITGPDASEFYDFAKKSGYDGDVPLYGVTSQFSLGHNGIYAPSFNSLDFTNAYDAEHFENEDIETPLVYGNNNNPFDEAEKVDERLKLDKAKFFEYSNSAEKFKDEIYL